MIPKSEGAKDNCPSCHQELICRTKTSEKYGDSLQWQYADREEAHFSYDFKTKKSSCKESSQKGSEAGRRVQETGKVHLKNIELPLDQIAEITAYATETSKRLLVALSAIETVCQAAGIDNPAKIGMIFNQVCEQRRCSQ